MKTITDRARAAPASAILPAAGASCQSRHWGSHILGHRGTRSSLLRSGRGRRPTREASSRRPATGRGSRKRDKRSRCGRENDRIGVGMCTWWRISGCPAAYHNPHPLFRDRAWRILEASAQAIQRCAEIFSCASRIWPVGYDELGGVLRADAFQGMAHEVVDQHFRNPAIDRERSEECLKPHLGYRNPE